MYVTLESLASEVDWKCLLTAILAPDSTLSAVNNNYFQMSKIENLKLRKKYLFCFPFQRISATERLRTELTPSKYHAMKVFRLVMQLIELQRVFTSCKNS